ncbi:MAG: hypothetical protein HYV28_20650 [Ignavibacteriales bacterium]|nr:hypothetical protein [Ignavibacteriales bacterium]
MVNQILLIAILLISSISAQEISVKVSADSSKYQIGDYIKYNVTIKHAKNIKVLQPSIQDSLKPLEFVSLDKADTTEGGHGFQVINYHYTLIGFDTGSVTVPSFTLLYTQPGDSDFQSIHTDSLALYISGIAIDTAAEFKDIKEPIKEPFDWTIVLIIAGIILALAIAAYYIIRYYRNKKGINVTEKTVVLTPYQEAMMRLQELEKKNLWKQGMVKEYHTEITEIVRVYFEKTFSFPALEQTSGEIINELKNRNLGIQAIEITEQFLNNADMVKFAKFSPLPQVNEEMLRQAYKLVEEQNRGMAAQSGSAKGDANANS